MIAEKNSLESRITMKVNQKFKNNREKMWKIIENQFQENNIQITGIIEKEN